MKHFPFQVPEHAELAWYFNTLTGVGKLQRMTTWKVSRMGNFEWDSS